jgi:dTDP-4-amino-4,6-dideoxygalactose transaminase
MALEKEQLMIPFNRPYIVGKELYYISQAVANGNLAGDGPFTRLCTQWMEHNLHAKNTLLVHSCTAALEMAAILSDIQPGDEVILPSYTFVSTANAFVLRGAKPVFIDIRPDTMNMDENQLESLISEKTKVICPVHYAGVACEMDTIMDIAEKHDLIVIEDAAQGVCATYKQRFLGTIGHLGCYSFHETKNFISGEGGALVVNDERFRERACILRDKGTNRAQFFRGESDKYTWVDIGSSYLASELTAAFLYAQLEESQKISSNRINIWNHYRKELLDLEKAGCLRLPHIPPECNQNAHMFYILLDSNKVREQLIQHLKRHDIYAVFHYVPLHNSPMGRKFHPQERCLPHTEALSERLLRLPCYYELTDADVSHITDIVKDFFKK